MSDEQFSSKRERQKARRAARLEKEAAQATVENRKRTLTYGLIVVVVVALIAALIFQQIQSRQAASEQAERAQAKLDELGCTEDARQPDLGGGHISGTADALSAEPPEVIYPDQPPSSGRHIGQVVPSGVFDVRIDPRFTTHNLEHGYIVAWYSPDAPAEEVDALKAWATDARDGDFPKIVVSEYYEPLADGKNIAYTAWFYRQTCDQFDVDVAETFARAHYDTAGEGPEKGIPAHNIGAQGVIDPEGEDLFLPPLDVAFGSDSVIEQTDDAGDPTDEDPDVTDPSDAADEPVDEPADEASEPVSQ